MASTSSSAARGVPATPSESIASVAEESVYRKVTWRLLPFLMLCYVVAYLDRVNVGFAKLQMLSDLQFSETIYGLGAGLFFVGYFLCEVPSNIILHRVGARIWIARIMITWGLISAAFAFVTTPAMFYALRFLLGLAEAGFFPGIILYLTYWYPDERRARIVALFMAAIPLSGVFGGPLSGWIMDAFSSTSGTPGIFGWNGWQWMFLIEAAPAVALGFAVLLYLKDGIRSATWLTEGDKQILERNIERNSQGKAAHHSLRAILADRRLWLMSAIYFCAVMGQYGLTFWMPSLIKAAGVTGMLQIGLLTAVPYTAAVVTMILVGRSADRHRERRWHLAIPMLLGAVGLTGSALADVDTGLAIAFLTLAAAGVITSAPLFWSLPTAFLGGAAAACGIAAINSVGNLAGFASPYLVGFLKDLTQSTHLGMYALTAVLVAGALMVLSVPARLVNR